MPKTLGCTAAASQDQTPVVAGAPVHAAPRNRLPKRVVAVKSARRLCLGMITRGENPLEDPAGMAREIGGAQVAIPKQRGQRFEQDLFGRCGAGSRSRCRDQVNVQARPERGSDLPQRVDPKAVSTVLVAVERGSARPCALCQGREPQPTPAPPARSTRAKQRRPVSAAASAPLCAAFVTRATQGIESWSRRLPNRARSSASCAPYGSRRSRRVCRDLHRRPPCRLDHGIGVAVAGARPASLKFDASFSVV